MLTFFGTDGIRGRVGSSPHLAAPFLHRLGFSLVQWAKAKHETPIFVIASDTRASAHDILYAVSYGIMKAGGIVFNAGIMPTPALQHLVTKHTHYYHYGIMITASHNPAEDNGLKIVRPEGKLSSADQEIITHFVAHTPPFTYCPVSLTIPPIPAHHTQSYMHHISSVFPATLLSGLRIVLDCAHGATYRIAPLLFQSCGAEILVIGNQPNGHNSNTECGSTNPLALQNAVKQHAADLGFAFDGDGDRVIAVNKQGDLFQGDEILGLLSTHPRFASQTTIIGTVLTNSGLSLWLATHKKKLVRSAVGDAHVKRIMRAHNAELGGEPSGHIIIHSHLPTADGIFAALYAAHTAKLTGNLSLKTFTKLAQASLSLPVVEPQSLTEEPFASIIQAHEHSILPGRSVIRYSGTEPVLRIMTEHVDEAVAESSSQLLAETLKPYLSDPGV
jgi:phosphoglucosamine mutase